MVDYYKVLKVSPEASAAEIKSAYRRLARKMHPDVNGGTEEATREFALIAKSYEVLSNPQERAYYDRQYFKAFHSDSNGSGSIHDSDSVMYSDNSHASRLRRIAYENRYNRIVDSIIDAERQEVLALQKVIFPIVALFLSTCFVAIFKPKFWSNSEIIGKIILLTLFITGVVHLFGRLRAGLDHYTYQNRRLHDSILGEIEEETRPYSRLTALAFLLVGIGVSLGVGMVIGNYLEMFIAASMPHLFSPTLRLEFIFYPPIVVLLVDAMHGVASKVDY
ncbi:MAG: J domain-containing protein [Acidobacteriota bacterium]|nr:J domain-containing protein [Acidobacteriota bacterium]